MFNFKIGSCLDFLLPNSINPTKGLIELSLKGKDVGGPDPAPKPERTNEKQEQKKRKRDTQKEKELKVVEASDDEAEDCKKPRKGEMNMGGWDTCEGLSVRHQEADKIQKFTSIPNQKIIIMVY